MNITPFPGLCNGELAEYLIIEILYYSKTVILVELGSINA